MKRHQFLIVLVLILVIISCNDKDNAIKIFDVHLHGDPDPEKQLDSLAINGVTTIAVSTSWPQQQSYQTSTGLSVLHGLFVPCPNGKVPYSLQQCFDDGKEWPDINWVEQQIKDKKIDFIGEVLSQYHGISSSDSLLYP